MKDFTKEWEATKKQLVKFGKEATAMAKKGEKELLRFSQQGKIQIDATATNLKMEKLYYSIGKEYVNAQTPSTPTAKLKKLIDDLSKLEKQQRALKRKLNATKGKKKKTSSQK